MPVSATHRGHPLLAWGRAFILSAILCLLTIVIGGPPAVSAQSGLEESPKQQAGPYQVSVAPSQFRSSPGRQLMLITVLDAEKGGPIPNASVTIRTLNETSGHSGWATALNTPSAPRVFTAIVNVDSPGRWVFSVDISSPLGQATVELASIEITKAQQSLEGYLVYGLVLGAIFFGGFYLWRKSKRLTQEASHTSGDRQRS